jgi:hypothetical protein
MSWLPDKDHPVWKTIQGILALSAIIFAAYHGMEGFHQSGLDKSDAAGMGGLGLAGKLVWQYMRSDS